jgi:23S rRNA pseudouridine2605 synthase
MTKSVGIIGAGIGGLALSIRLANQGFKVTIFEGKNREIRKVFDYCGLRVNRLIRVGFGPYELGDLQVGEVQELQINQKFLEQCK